MAHAYACHWYSAGHNTRFPLFCPDKGSWLARAFCALWFWQKRFTCVLTDGFPRGIPSIKGANPPPTNNALWTPSTPTRLFLTTGPFTTNNTVVRRGCCLSCVQSSCSLPVLCWGRCAVSQLTLHIFISTYFPPQTTKTIATGLRTQALVEETLNTEGRGLSEHCTFVICMSSLHLSFRFQYSSPNHTGPSAIIESPEFSQGGNLKVKAVYLWLLSIFLRSISGMLIISHLPNPYTFSLWPLNNLFR